MIRTKFSIADVPSNWIFQHYCKLQEQLYGQDIKIRSLFNTDERTPSMCIYYDGKNYKYKDFSSGNAGNGVQLIVDLYKMSLGSAIQKIRYDYDNQEVISDTGPIKSVAKFKVTSHVKRRWTEIDAKFWTDFNIGSIGLGEYNVFPLSEFSMSKATDEGIDEIIISGQRIYGYFTNSGELYKVYQPYGKTKKFINVQRYVQGSEQLTYKKPLLVICSSLKDIMALNTLEFPIECVAPSSENSMLAKALLTAYSLKYKGIITFFDNDEAGRVGMHKYEDKYGIPGIYLKMSKDISDSIRDFGPKKTKQYLTPLIPTV